MNRPVQPTPRHAPRPTPHGSLPAPLTPHSALRTPHSRSGVALVVTLLLLSIITFMVVTFLVVSRSQKGSVTTETDQAIARLAADMALERAKAAIIAPMLAWTNEFNYGLLVSANYVNRDGFNQTLPINNPPIINPTNVNYDYTRAGIPLTFGDQRNQNIANLLYDPRPPVFVTTNRLQPPEFRYYLDWNRNGRYETNGLLPVISDDPANPYFNIDGTLMPLPTQGVTLSNYFVGDPEWIGTLERPEFAHSADNKFVNRYAYIAVPIGQTLDLNNIHNDAKRRPMNSPGDGFFRNQGVLTAEINLAAFLADLNTNLWPTVQPNKYTFGPYNYDTSYPVLANRGAAFDDAFALLRYRYANSLARLANVSSLFGPPGVSAFSPDLMDAYSGGPLMTGTSWPPPGYSPVNQPRVNNNWPWAGGDNPEHFYTTQDLLDRSKTGVGVAPAIPTLTDRLRMAGTNIDSYNRYTFSRLVAQLGTDSAPEPPGKINLNYRNVDDNGNVVPDMATNFIPWIPVQFFTNAANRLLADAGYNFTTAGIQLYPTNYYTPSVHRLLQLAANMYDATITRTNSANPAYPYLPSVFRPLFLSTNGGNRVFISGYTEENGTQFLAPGWPWRDLQLPSDRAALQPLDMAYGVPVIIGAKKGFPNFNKFAMRTTVQATRKLEFVRQNNNSSLPIAQTNQMYVLSISNVFGVEAWNSYANYFPRGLHMTVRASMSACVSNVLPAQAYTIWNFSTNFAPNLPNIPANSWAGFVDKDHSANSVIIPLWTNFLTLTNSQYLQNTAPPRFVPYRGHIFEHPSGFATPNWWVAFTNRILYALVDIQTGRIVDCANLSAGEDPVNITELLTQGGGCGDATTPYNYSESDGAQWCTNRGPGVTSDSVPTFGVRNQIAVGQGMGTPASAWSTRPENLAACDFFRVQFGLGAIHFQGKFTQTNTFYAPYVPSRTVYFYTSWQANDPLVHYTIPDLTDLLSSKKRVDVGAAESDPMKNFGTRVFLNDHYRPWGGNPNKSGSDTDPPTKWALALKDPAIVTQNADRCGHSDNWDFPTNKLPNVGWLGRVHRGTPWQTVYLKSPVTDPLAWQKWTGNDQRVPYVGQFPANRVPLYYAPGTTNGMLSYDDVLFSHPTNDWRILDLFTTGLSDNATRGQLSINQTNLAAWSAVLSGVITLTNTPMVDTAGKPVRDLNGNLMPTPLTIQPAGFYEAYVPATWPPLVRIVNGINNMRTNFLNKTFQTLGDILATPELTVASPFLNTNIPPTDLNYVLNDAVCERIPQQILGLLKCDHTPRFVVYSFGQTLKPAGASIVNSGTFFGLCTNYQIMAEAATRAVIRIEGAPANPRAVVESFNLLPPD